MLQRDVLRWAECERRFMAVEFVGTAAVTVLTAPKSWCMQPTLSAEDIVPMVWRGH